VKIWRKEVIGDLFGISEKWLGAYLELFSKTRVFLKICGLRVNCGKGMGLNEKVARISGF
jgi:hypothetical protein